MWRPEEDTQCPAVILCHMPLRQSLPEPGARLAAREAPAMPSLLLTMLGLQVSADTQGFTHVPHISTQLLMLVKQALLPPSHCPCLRFCFIKTLK